MKKALYLILAIAIASISYASTTITSGSVSGHWTLSGSPYLINNNISVDYGTNLVIDAGVDVIFQGPYGFTISGMLEAAGTATMPVNFHVADTTGWSTDSAGVGGWEGITFDPYYDTIIDSSSLVYCNIFDTKDVSSNLQRAIKLNYCSFYHNKSGALAVIADPTKEIEISNCQFYNNLGQMIIPLDGYSVDNGPIHFHKNQVYNNTGQVAVIHCGYVSLVVDSNSIYSNYQADTTNGSVFEMYNCIALIENNRVYANTTMEDGAISCFNTKSDINANYICNNSVLVGGLTATCGHIQGGGGIRIDDEGDTAFSTNSIRNNIIANNRTAYFGAGVYVIGANAMICNNTIVNNLAEQGGIYFFGETGNNIKVKNNILYNNVSENVDLSGVADTMSIHVGSADTFLYEYNWAQHSFTGDVYDGIVASVLIGDTTKDVVGNSPQLIAPTATIGDTESALTANFGLLSTSPCINKGDIANVQPGAADYAGNSRIAGGIIDIGGYEYGAGPAGVSNITALADEGISVYPNPAVNVIFVATTESTGVVYLQDITGKNVLEKEVSATLTSFDIHEVPRGMYLITCNRQHLI